MNDPTLTDAGNGSVEYDVDLESGDRALGDDRLTRPGPEAAATDLAFLIEFRWQASSGIQPVLFAERVLLH